MSLIIDASMLSGLPSGPVTFADGVSRAWSERATERPTVWASEPGARTATRLKRHLLRPRASFVGATTYLSVNPTLPRCLPSHVRSGVVVHDLRHEQEPDSFSSLALAYRHRFWTDGIQRADVVFTSSEPTRATVAQRFGVEAITVPMGVDHVTLERSDSSLEPAHGAVLAMCHRENKPPEVAIEAWRFACEQTSGELPDLCVIGLDPDRRAELGRSTPEVDTGRISLHGRLPDAEFRACFANAAALLFLSTHEGYGLPVAEAQALGVPIVASELSSIREIVGAEEPLAATNEPAVAGALLVEVLAAERPAPLRSTNWADTVAVLSEALESPAESASPTRPSGRRR